MEISIKVTSIKGRYHARLYGTNGELFSEMVCVEKCDIGYICQQLCRDYDKFGPSDSKHAEWSRMRQDVKSPKGKIENIHVHG
jgi:hypothetical protein